MIPCTDSYKKVDLRTVSFDVPPQEVHEDDDNDDDDESLMKMTMSMLTMKMKFTVSSYEGALSGLGDCHCGCGHILQSLKSNHGFQSQNIFHILLKGNVTITVMIALYALSSYDQDMINDHLITPGNKQCGRLQSFNSPSRSDNTQVVKFDIQKDDLLI